MFNLANVSRVLYRNVLYRTSNDKVITFKKSNDVILRNDFINLIENYFINYFRQFI